MTGAPTRPWGRRIVLGVLVGLIARLWLRTLRLTLKLDPALAQAASRPWSLAFWHGQQFGILRWKRRRLTAALVSLSRDGELQTGALSTLGLAIVRGSSTRGGAAGLKGIVRHMRQGLDSAFAVDGPRGPLHVVRSDLGSVGAALAARMSNGVVIPMASACSRCFVFRRAWDRFELPLPFTRVAVVLGRPLEPEEASPDELKKAIDRARTRAESLVLSPPLDSGP